MDTKWRMWLESQDIAHVLAVAKNSMVVTMQLTRARVDRVIAELGEDAWTPMSCGDGAHGPRIYDWAISDIRPLEPTALGRQRLRQALEAHVPQINEDLLGPLTTVERLILRELVTKVLGHSNRGLVPNPKNGEHS